jgi:soluble lytic murein transglycosylase
MWFVRFFSSKFCFILLFSGILVLASADKTSATTVSHEVKLSENDKITLRTALKKVSQNHLKKAAVLSKKLENPLARKIIHYLYLVTQGTTGSFKQLSSFINKNPHWPKMIDMRSRAEEAISIKMPPQAVLNWFSSENPVSTDGWIKYIRALLAVGDKDKARGVIRKTWINKNFAKRPEQYFYKHYRHYLTKEDHLKRLERLLWQGKDWPARRMLWKVSPEHRAQAEARLMLRHGFGNVDAAIAKVPPNQVNNPGLTFERLRWRRIKGRYEQSLELLEATPSDLVYPEKWWKERSYLARTALNRGHITTAYRLVKNHQLQEGPNFADAEWLAGWIALRFLDEPKIAFNHFERMYQYVKYPISRARGAYWTGRAAEALRKMDVAVKWFRVAAKKPTTYYGQLAANHLDATNSLQLPVQPDPTPQEIDDFQKLDLVKAIKILNEINAQKQMRHFIISLSDYRKTTGWRLLTARLAIKYGRPDVGITIAKKSSRQGEELIEVGYPLLKLPSLKNRFSREPLESPLIMAMIRQESAFYARAKSHANAHGLMQILPRTAKKIAGNLKIKYSKNRLISDPNYNMILGQAYLAKLIDEFNGSYVMALAGYNAGPGRAHRWARQNGSPRKKTIDTIDWIEMIPFKETRNYVQRVLENLQIYRLKLGDNVVVKTLKQDLVR